MAGQLVLMSADEYKIYIKNVPSENFVTTRKTKKSKFFLNLAFHSMN